MFNNIKISDYKDYQLEMCAAKMDDLYKRAADNLTGAIASTTYHACNEELVKRGLKPITSSH